MVIKTMDIISIGRSGDEVYVVLDSSYTVDELEEIVNHMKELNKRLKEGELHDIPMPS